MTRKYCRRLCGGCAAIRMAALVACFVVANGLVGKAQSAREYTFKNGRLVGVQSGGVYSSSVPAPTLSWANHIQGQRVDLYWCIGSYGAASFDIERVPGGIIRAPGGSGCIIWTDPSVRMNTAYTYRVRARDASGNFGAFSGMDIATVVDFTNEPLRARIDIVDPAHFDQLRSAVSVVAARAGTAPIWNDQQWDAGIKAIHLVDIRTNLTQALTQIGLPAVGYTDTIATGVTVKAIHVQEIRDRVK